MNKKRKEKNNGSAYFLGPETDVMGQFMWPETKILDMRYFINIQTQIIQPILMQAEL
jgi:hypothetical protein